MEENNLITKAEKYLEQIKLKSIDLSKISNLDNFVSLYQSLNQSHDYLVQMRDEMIRRGFESPYGHSSISFKDVPNNELSEISRHSQYFRMKANSKKIVLDMVKSAVSSHRIAISNLSEYALIKPKNINEKHKKAKSFKITDSNIDIDEIDSNSYLIERNQKTVYRLEILPYLPLSGNYKVLMSSLTDSGLVSFKKIVNALRQKKNAVVKTVSVTIKRNKNGRIVTERLNFDSDYVDNYEEKLREMYGNNFAIKNLEFNKSKPSIINEKHTRTALAIAYAKFSEKIIDTHIDDILKDNIKDYNSLKLYDEIVYDINTQNPHFIDDEEELEQWRKDKLDLTLVKVGLMNKEYILNTNLQNDLNTRKTLKLEVFSEIGSTLILWDIFKYYLTTSNDRRKRYRGLFPYLRGDIDRRQRQVFDSHNGDTIDLLVKYANEHILKIPEMDLILFNKFKLEKKIKRLPNWKVDYSLIGPTLLLSQNTDSQNINCDDEFIKSVLLNFNLVCDDLKKGLEEKELIDSGNTNNNSDSTSKSSNTHNKKKNSRSQEFLNLIK
ncbi:MAG: DUF530 domain-containing protein [Methanobrevibacter sp.]|jgi:Zn-finger domain-containing protein|nr:DUF530 domain-containing protein [Candidatus Methanoflexus mossambicus]